MSHYKSVQIDEDVRSKLRAWCQHKNILMWRAVTDAVNDWIYEQKKSEALTGFLKQREEK